MRKLTKTDRTHNSEKGQANKGARGMPWHWKPTKDVAIYEKPRGDESSPRSVDIRMGKPGWAIPSQPLVNKIASCGEPSELKHLSRTRKRNQPRFR